MHQHHPILRDLPVAIGKSWLVASVDLLDQIVRCASVLRILPLATVSDRKYVVAEYHGATLVDTHGRSAVELKHAGIIQLCLRGHELSPSVYVRSSLTCPHQRLPLPHRHRPVSY